MNDDVLRCVGSVGGVTRRVPLRGDGCAQNAEEVGEDKGYL